MKVAVTVILEPEEDGGYSIHCPALPGCSSQGDTLAEALANIQEAILGVLKIRQIHNSFHLWISLPQGCLSPNEVTSQSILSF